MMKKMTSKSILLLVVFFMVFAVFSGCGEGETTGSSSSGNEDSYIVGDHRELVDGIYVTCGSDDITITSESLSPHIVFYLFSLEPLPENLHAVLDTGVYCETVIGDLTPDYLDEESCPLYLYQTMAGIDWEQAAVLKQAKADAYAAHYADIRNEELKEAYNAANDAYTAYMEQFSEGYEAYLAEKHTPVYYYYQIHINKIGWPKEEAMTIREVTLTNGEWSYTVSLGQVARDPTRVDLSYGKGVTQTGSAFTTYEGTPWESGNRGGWPLVKFTAKEDLEITDICFQGENQPEIQYADISITSNGKTIETQWTPGSTLKIRSGEEVTVTPHYYDPVAQRAEYVENRALLVKYEVGGEVSYVSGSFYNVRMRDGLEIYLWLVKGLNTRPYFTEYVTVS